MRGPGGAVAGRGEGSRSVLAGASSRVAEGLARVGEELRAAGMPVPAWEGRRIRPLVGWAASRRIAPAAPGSPEELRLWRALGAVQLAHEASLLHDDVIDGAPIRRGAPTVVAARGVGAALVEGDHLLTSAYRLAAATRSLAWVDRFARAVERTVAGERAQAVAGRPPGPGEYEEILLGKSGELLGAALAAPAVLAGHPAAPRHYELGRRIGLVYQMLDDLLDYCPGAGGGKAALADHGRGLWTWPLEFVDAHGHLPAEEVMRRLGRPDHAGTAPVDRAVERLRDEAVRVAAEAGELLPGDAIIGELLGGWIVRAEEAAAMLRPDGPRAPAAAIPSPAREAIPSPARERAAAALPPVDGWEDLLRTHARSFHFASRLFPAARRRHVAGVYAWCRYTDELVDGGDAGDGGALPEPALEARLDAWLDVSGRAYRGERTGNDLADRVMSDMRAAGVPFGYAAELIEGMRMDVRGDSYATLADLRRYTYRVASVVGLWLCELFGIRDPWMLTRASSLGHAMQLTNIARDVGEDLRVGRVYIPAEWLAQESLSRADLVRMMEAGAPGDGLRAVIERLLDAAEAEYDVAAAAIPLLPGFFRRPVAVAAALYRGIHDDIRRTRHDTLTRRAHTTLRTKLRLGGAALRRLAVMRRRPCSCVRLAAALGLVFVAFLAAAGVAAQTPPGSQSAPPARPMPAPVHAPAAISAEAGPPAALVVGPASVSAVSLPRAPADAALDAVRRLWELGVDEERAVDAGLEAIGALRERRRPAPSSRLDLVLRAYAGSFTALRGKHGGWPPARLRALRDGFALMDSAVAEAPEAAEIRYIRLLSGFHLPGILGRKGEVAQDMAALIRLLPTSAGAFAPDLFPRVVTFVLENGDPPPERRKALEATISDPSAWPPPGR